MEVASVESEEPVVVVKKEAKKGKKRVKLAQEDGNEEDRALALLGNDDF